MNTVSDVPTLDEIPKSIKWRNSTYQLESVENGEVHWYNPVSRHRAKCSISSWVKDGDPYEGYYGWHR